MDVWRLTVAVVRRWYIFLPLLALTAVAALQVGNGVKPQFEVTATAMVSTGRTSGEVPNPYGGREDAAQILAIVLNSNETRAAVEDQGLNPEYTVNAGSRSNIVNFAVQAETPELGIATLDAVLAAAATELKTRQTDAGVIAAAQYTADTLQAPGVAEVVDDGKMRIMAVIGVLGAALAFLLAVLFDDLIGLIKRIRRKRREKRSRTADDQAHERSPDDATASPATESPGEDEAPPASDEHDESSTGHDDEDRLARAGRGRRDD